jgi:hypothetical protein
MCTIFNRIQQREEFCPTDLDIFNEQARYHYFLVRSTFASRHRSCFENSWSGHCSDISFDHIILHHFSSCHSAHIDLFNFNSVLYLQPTITSPLVAPDRNNWIERTFSDQLPIFISFSVIFPHAILLILIYSSLILFFIYSQQLPLLGSSQIETIGSNALSPINFRSRKKKISGQQ